MEQFERLLLLLLLLLITITSAGERASWEEATVTAAQLAASLMWRLLFMFSISLIYINCLACNNKRRCSRRGRRHRWYSNSPTTLFRDWLKTVGSSGGFNLVAPAEMVSEKLGENWPFELAEKRHFAWEDRATSLLDYDGWSDGLSGDHIVVVLVMISRRIA